MAGLLHEDGHGPFGHFFDEHYLSRFGLTHETLGCAIIRQDLADLIRRVRGNPNSRLAAGETLDPEQIALLITRPKGDDPPDVPKWLKFLRSLFSGIYTVDNMDFVLRDAYMSGYSARAFDLDRLLRYSRFSSAGQTIQRRGIEALIRFMTVRGELFHTIYFHRTVRAIDLSLAELFDDSRDLLFPGNPLEHLAEYQQFTEWSLLVDVGRWAESAEPRRRELGLRWRELIARRVRWKMVCQRNLVFGPGDSESASIFSLPQFVEQKLRENLPAELRGLPLKIDLARHVHRPNTRGPAEGQNFLYDEAQNRTEPLTNDQLFRQLPLSHRICRVYAESDEHAAALGAALDRLLGPGGADDITNV